ncbi:hypothetical protein B484DRAFT_248711 [Ochromonadaceae sp. CCMP2298]|nr:hypothetical protein B484DRAFT_248711 [Ochromonadaceae sp. CCMP2298]
MLLFFIYTTLFLFPYHVLTCSSHPMYVHTPPLYLLFPPRYVYNKRAIQQSQDLCRVTTSHSLIMTQPLVETDRIFDQLRACGVLVPKKLTLSEVSNFVDPKLQHGKNALKDNPCLKDLSTLIPPDSWKTVDAGHLTLYREVIRAFCAMEDGTAYGAGFQWDETIKD